MKNISREAIQRMVGGVNSVIGGGAGGGGDLAGYATEMWVEDKYVNKEFFSSLFKAYDANGNEVLPNDTATTIDNIKAMFGFWTDFYISALGTGGHQSVDLRLAQLADVNVAGVTNGQVLTYNSTTGKWVASTPQAGTDMATVWANLAAADNTKQIDASHLSTALTGYATQTWVTNQGYITSSGNAASATKLKNARTIWGQSFDGTANVSGAITGATTISASSNVSVGGTLGVTGATTLSSTLSVTGATTLSSTLSVGGVTTIRNYCLFKTIDNNSSAGYVGRGSEGSNAIYLVGYSGNAVNIGANNSATDICIDTNHNVGIGTGSPSHKLHVNGGIYSTSYVTALSDARHKDVIGDTGLTVEQIAGAPSIRFTWNDRDDKTVFAGSIAQYWQKVLPEVVQSQADGTLSLDYQVAALISSITVARKVMNHESRLQRLEKMFAINEDDIED